jgi:hypothetical protein
VIGGDHPIWAVMAEHDLSPAERLVFIALAARCGSTGRCWLAHDDLVRRTGFSRERVRMLMRSLRRRGLVLVVGRHPVEGKTRDRWPNEYRLPVMLEGPRTDTREGSRATTRERSPATSGHGRPERVVTGDRRGGSPVTPKGPYEEPGKDQPVASTSPKRKPRPPEPHRERAETVLREWWERQQPRPVQPYPAALKVCTKALAGGWTDAELTAALDDVHVISGAALDRWRRARGNGQDRSASPATIDTILDRAQKRYGGTKR